MSRYMCHAVGFFLQIYPCTVLCLIPAGEEGIRFPKKKIFFWVTAAVVILSALFPLALAAGGWGPNTYGIGNVYMLVSAALFAVAYFWLFRQLPLKKLLILFLVIFYAVSQYVLVMLLHPFLEYWNFLNGALNDYHIYSIHSVLLWALTDAVMLPIAAAFGCVVRDYLQEIETKSMKREFCLVMVSTLFYIVSITYFDVVVTAVSLNFQRASSPIFLVLMFSQCLTYWLLLRESLRRRRENDQQKLLEIQQLQCENIAREMENARRMRHDMRHWLNGLNDLLEQDKTEEMKAYLAQVIDKTAKRESETYCRNVIVNGLLQYYVGIARDAGIRCLVQADCGDLTISPTDLTRIFGNAMENAIRACESCPEDPYISIQVGTIGGSLAIQIENTCLGVHPSGKYRLGSGFLPAAAFLSVHSGGGYGLKSLEHTAQKYGGDAKFQYDEATKTFTTRVRLNLHPTIL